MYKYSQDGSMKILCNSLIESQSRVPKRNSVALGAVDPAGSSTGR